MKFLLNNPYFNAIKRIRQVLDQDQRRRSILMIILMIINALFDVLGLASIALLIKSALEGDILGRETYTLADADSEQEYIFNNQLRRLYEWSGVESEIELLFYISIFIFIVFIIKNALSLVITYTQAKFSFNISLRLNKKMFKNYYDRGYLFIHDASSGKKIYRIVEVPMRFASHILMHVLLFSTQLMVIIILCIALLMYRPLAVLLLMMAVTPVFVIIYLYSKNRIKEIGYERNIRSPKNYATVLQSMKGYTEIKLSNREQETLTQYEFTQRSINSLDAIFQGFYGKINQKTNDIVFGLGILTIFGYAHWSKASVESVLTLLGFFGLAAYKVLPAINNMMGSLLNIKNNAYVFDELLELKGMEYPRFEHYKKVPFTNSIELRNLCYRYPESHTDVIHELNLAIRKGETIGIVGESGSGKSTLLKILLRLIEEISGSFIVDGKELVTAEDNAAYQLNVGYVEQEVFILDGNLLENIIFGRDIDQSMLQRAITDSMLSDLVASHPDGLQMQLGESGVKLSGGQKQRVGIARALYKQSEILVFDEVTSALDPVTEKAIVETIHHLTEIGKTVIIVAHRITTLEKCDRIIELKNGRVVREPTYEELIDEIVT